jgi:hypothetical protein
MIAASLTVAHLPCKQQNAQALDDAFLLALRQIAAIRAAKTSSHLSRIGES